MNLQEEIQQEIAAQADSQYAAFTAHLLPSGTKILGVRLPWLRKLAQRLIKSGQAREYSSHAPYETLEDCMLQAFLIAGMDSSWPERRQYIREFLPHIHNWSVCDSFCSSLKDTRTHKKEYIPFIMECLHATAPYTQRFAIVMILNYYTEKEYAPKAFAAFDALKTPHYYVRMAIAWAISIFFIKETEQTRRYLLHNQLDPDILRKSIQKCLESRRVLPADKEWLCQLRQKINALHHQPQPPLHPSAYPGQPDKAAGL